MRDPPGIVWVSIEAAQMTEDKHVARIMAKINGEPSVPYVLAAHYEKVVKQRDLLIEALAILNKAS